MKIFDDLETELNTETNNLTENTHTLSNDIDRKTQRIIKNIKIKLNKQLEQFSKLIETTVVVKECVSFKESGKYDFFRAVDNTDFVVLR